MAIYIQEDLFREKLTDYLVKFLDDMDEYKNNYLSRIIDYSIDEFLFDKVENLVLDSK